MTTNTSAEILIERKITFRNSTFGGLKAYIREHERKTGDRLTNAAAVDRLLRAQLVYAIDRRAASEMMALAQPEGAAALRVVEDTPEPRPQLLPDDAADHLRAYQQRQIAGGAA